MKIVFICGAPRSGTTLLTELLSGHPELVVFPGESRIATYWYSLKTNEERDRFFSRDYLNTFEIKILVDETAKKQHAKYIEKIYDVKSQFKDGFDVDAYLNHLNIYYNGPSVINVYYAVACGLVGSKVDYDSTRFVIKMPLDHEILAFELSKYNSTHFIHLYRNPIDRYVSAKIRNRRRGFIVSENNFAIKHASVSMLSDQLFYGNKMHIGETYLSINYDRLISDLRDVEMEFLAKDLGISWSDILMEQNGVQLSSHKKKSKTTQVERHLSRSEKNIIGFFSNSTPLKPSDFIVPYKYENSLHYIRNRKEMLRTMRGNLSVVQMRFYHDMLKRFYNGEDIGD